MLIFLSWGRRPGCGPDIVRMYGDCPAGAPGIHWCRKADGTIVAAALWNYAVVDTYDGGTLPPQSWWDSLGDNRTAKKMHKIVATPAFRAAVEAYLAEPTEPNCRAVQESFDDEMEGERDAYHKESRTN